MSRYETLVSAGALDDIVERAALVAAQGAAPQAECNCGAGPGSAVCKKVCATRAAEYRKGEGA